LLETSNNKLGFSIYVDNILLISINLNIP